MLDTSAASGGTRSPAPALRPRCLFCGTTDGKRSREHVLRRAFKKSHSVADNLTFSSMTEAGMTVYQRPHSQFDMTVNRVCKDCNEGWLNDLENTVTETLALVPAAPSGVRIDKPELDVLAFWAYVRALLRTHVSPAGRAPESLFEQAFLERRVPHTSFVQLGWSTHYMFVAGGHQSLVLQPLGTYLAYVSLGLSGLMFFVTIAEAGDGMRRYALDVSRRPRLWFPGTLHWLAPSEPLEGHRPPRILSLEESRVAGASLMIRMGIRKPVDYFGEEFDPLLVIPPKFHSTLSWEDAGYGIRRPRPAD